MMRAGAGRVLFVVALWLAGGLGPWGGAARAQHVTASVSADSVTVGERFFLTLLIDRAPTQRPLLPDEAPPAVDSVTGNVRLGALELIDRVAASTRPLAAGGERDSIVYEVTTFALDSLRVPPLVVPFTADGDTVTVIANPLEVAVVSLVPEDAADIRDLAPLADFPRLVWHWVLLGAVMLMLLGLLVYYRRHRPVPEAPVVAAPAPPSVSPYEEALRRLRALEGVDPGRPEAVKPYYVALSEGLRWYLGRRLGVAAMESTTRELVYDLRVAVRRGRLTPDVPVVVARVLELADFAKFADGRPSAEAGREALHHALTAVQRVEARMAQAPPEDTGDVAPRETSGELPVVTPAIDGATLAVADDRRRIPVMVVLGGVGMVVAGYVGGLWAALPWALALAAYGTARRWAPADRRPLLAAVAVQAGLYAWLLLRYVWAPELVAVPWLASGEVVLAVATLAWLLARPGWPPAAVLVLVHLAALGGRFFGDAPAPGEPLALVEAVLRLLAVGGLLWGLRRPGTPPQGNPSPRT